MESPATNEVVVNDAQNLRRETDDMSSQTLMPPDSIDHSEIVTLQDFRNELYRTNPGLQDIRIARDSFLERVIGVYKDPCFDLKKKTRVEFFGEAGNFFSSVAPRYLNLKCNYFMFRLGRFLILSFSF